jgi:hypothetical protein
MRSQLPWLAHGKLFAVADSCAAGGGLGYWKLADGELEEAAWCMACSPGGKRDALCDAADGYELEVAAWWMACKTWAGSKAELDGLLDPSDGWLHEQGDCDGPCVCVCKEVWHAA